MHETEVIMRDSQETATYRTNIRGWVSRHGQYYGDGPSGEQAARYGGCTHVSCRDCAKPAEKGWLICVECRRKADVARYAALPRKEWDGAAMLYSEARGRFYNDIESAEDDQEEER